MNLPKDLEQYILLYLYGELEEAERRAFEAHVEHNDQSRRRLEEMREFHNLLDRKAMFEPSDELLGRARSNLREQLREERKSLLRDRWWQKFIHVSAKARWSRVAGAVAVFVLGILVGRFVASGADGLAVSSKGVSSSELETPSFISNIDMIQYEPESGAVTVRYKRVQDVSLRGNIGDESIRQVLSYAIRTDEHPGRRLEAVKASSGRRFRDEDLEDALIYAMEKDEIEGVRLRAAKVLRALPISSKIKAAFIRMLLKDPNPAIRMEALDGLRKVHEQDVYPIFQDAMRDDENASVRLRASRALERIEQPAVPNGKQ